MTVRALQFLPEDSEPTPPGVIDAVPVSEREIALILAIARNFRQIVEPGEFLFQLASLFVMISRHGEDLLTSNPATAFENPVLVPDAEVPQKIRNVIRLHRVIQAFKNRLIHFFDGRKRPTAISG
jgi:hypothetical protein